MLALFSDLLSPALITYSTLVKEITTHVLMLFYRVISGSLVPKRASIMLWKWYSKPTLTVEQGLWNTPLGGTRPSSVSLARASVGRLGWDLGTRNQLKGNDISWPEQLNSPLQDSINVPFCYYNCLLLSLSLSQWEWTVHEVSWYHELYYIGETFAWTT